MTKKDLKRQLRIERNANAVLWAAIDAYGCWVRRRLVDGVYRLPPPTPDDVWSAIAEGSAWIVDQRARQARGGSTDADTRTADLMRRLLFVVHPDAGRL